MTSVVKMTNCLNKIICYNFKKYGIEQPRAALVAQRLKHLPAMQETWIRSLGREDPRRKNPLQYSCLENPMDGGAWWATVCGVAKSWTGLSDFTFTLLGRVQGEDRVYQVSVFLVIHVNFSSKIYFLSESGIRQEQIENSDIFKVEAQLASRVFK